MFHVIHFDFFLLEFKTWTVSDIVTVDIILPHRWTDKRGGAGYEWIGRHCQIKTKKRYSQGNNAEQRLTIGSIDGRPGGPAKVSGLTYPSSRNDTK
jgi:hypothetical protein